MHLYKDPDNKFVAGFIGSPSMNFVNGEVTDGGVLVPALGGTVIPTQVALPATGSSVTVGLRPQELLLNPGDGDINWNYANAWVGWHMTTSGVRQVSV